MPYKTIKKEFPEYGHHESHLHELREKSKENERKMTEHIRGHKHPQKDSDEDIEIGEI